MGEPHGQIVKAFKAYGQYDGPNDNFCCGQIARRLFAWRVAGGRVVDFFHRHIDETIWSHRNGSMFSWVASALGNDFPPLYIGPYNLWTHVKLATWDRPEMSVWWMCGNADHSGREWSSDPALVRLCCDFGLTGEPSPPFLDLLQDTFPRLRPFFEAAACER